MNRYFTFLLLIVSNLITLPFLSAQTNSQASLDPCESGQIPPDQNACVLLATIPPELRNLPYGIYPNDPSYDTTRFIFNKRFNVFPHAIFAPRIPEEVTYVLRILKEHNLETFHDFCSGTGSC